MQIADNDAAYLACRSLCEGLVAAGISDAVVSPGSRSMPLALTVDATAGLRTWVRIDERSAGYFALGLAKGSGRPVVLVCTSGTAAANYLPTVVEAHYSGVPLVVLTADRPPELRGWGAGQTIDQHSLYGSHVRWFCETPVASELPVADAVRWFGVAAARAVTLATGMNPGPVHLNVPFRAPLEPLEPVGSIGVGSSPGVSGGEGQCSAPAIQQVATSQTPAPPLPIRAFVPGTGFGVSAGDVVELVAVARWRGRGVGGRMRWRLSAERLGGRCWLSLARSFGVSWVGLLLLTITICCCVRLGPMLSRLRRCCGLVGLLLASHCGFGSSAIGLPLRWWIRRVAGLMRASVFRCTCRWGRTRLPTPQRS